MIVRNLDLDDVKADLGRFGKLHVRHGKGARGSGHRERMVPLIKNDAGPTRRWFIEDVWGHFERIPEHHEAMVRWIMMRITSRRLVKYVTVPPTERRRAARLVCRRCQR